MEMYIERGESRKDCELKIAEKYKQPFTIYSTKPAKIGGIFGLFGKDGVEVEFYFNPVLPSAFNRTLQSGASSSSYPISAPLQPRPVINELPPRNSPEDLEEAKKKVIAAAGIDLKQVLEKKENSEKQQQLQQQQQKQQEQILELLQEVNEKLDTGVKNDDHPSLVQAERLLKLNDFSEKYTKKMLERLRKEVPFETLDNFDAVQELFDLRPAAIIKKLNLRKPIYKALASYGHMGREDLNVAWEKADMVDGLKNYFTKE